MKRYRHPQSRCELCGSSESDCFFFHTIRCKGACRRLCTNCVLKINQSLFCPICFDVFDRCPPPASQRVMCFSCPSIAHLSCVLPHLSSDFKCPSCSDPRFTFFEVSSPCQNINSTDICGNDRHIGSQSAKALVAAARIAAASMRKAAAEARFDAERKVKIAALAKKHAREALDRVASLSVKNENGSPVTPPKRSHR